ncbi:MAG: TetR/AcrR family transcriptional regulator [Acidimicrobiales bacterium]
MGRPPTDARQRLADAAAALLREQGLHASGVKQIAAAARVPMGSLYFHFPGGKQELVRSAMTAAGSAVDQALDRVCSFSGSAREAVAAHLEQSGAALAASGYRSGCPLATTALELGPDDADVAEVIAAWFSSWRARIEAALHADGYVEADSLATLVLAALEGGLLLARVERDLAPLASVAATLDALLAGAPRTGG